jgi:hypothetical protein
MMGNPVAVAISWKLVGKGGANKAKAVAETIKKQKAKAAQKHQGSPGNLVAADVPLPEDANKVASFQQRSSQGITFFGKGQCLVGVVRMTPLGIFSMEPVRFFLAPF